MRMVDLIAAKRDGVEHERSEIEFIISGIMSGEIPDYQLSAWLMAVCFQGLSHRETAWLTEAMCNSGDVLDLGAIAPIVGDKHSTGGVGDKTTLVFVPLLASAGIPMAKLSGRGLGHTGGTIDKLEAIPGFRVELTKDQFIEQVARIGMAVAGQTSELAPADGKIYALRDVTATVASVPLIAASVMSKKLAAGANLIILDVKAGRGAFMESCQQAEMLSSAMVQIGRELGRRVIAVVTDMEQPLGMAVGHSLEVIEAIETLKGNGPADLVELCLALGSQALVAAGKSVDEKSARQQLSELLTSGAALESFKTLIEAQSGNPKVLDDYSLMPTASHVIDLKLPAHCVGSSGFCWVEHLDGRLIAEACKLMGAGRERKGEPINLAVGIVLKAKVGSRLEPLQSIAEIHCDNLEIIETIENKVLQAFEFSKSEVEIPPVALSCLV